MVWGFPLFARGLGWFYRMHCWGLGLVLVLSDPLVTWQPMAKGLFFSFYILNKHINSRLHYNYV
jgi:hypothetical protein